MNPEEHQAIILFTETLAREWPDVTWSLTEPTYEGLVWHSETEPKPSKEEFEAAIEITRVHRRRRAEYPSIGDQLDDLFKKGAFGDEMTVRIQAVKDRHPLPLKKQAKQ